MDDDILIVDDSAETFAEGAEPRRLRQGQRVIDDRGKQRGVVLGRTQDYHGGGGDIEVSDHDRPGLEPDERVWEPEQLRTDRGHHRGMAEKPSRRDVMERLKKLGVDMKHVGTVSTAHLHAMAEGMEKHAEPKPYRRPKTGNRVNVEPDTPGRSSSGTVARRRSGTPFGAVPVEMDDTITEDLQPEDLKDASGQSYGPQNKHAERPRRRPRPGRIPEEGEEDGGDEGREPVGDRVHIDSMLPSRRRGDRVGTVTEDAGHLPNEEHVSRVLRDSGDIGLNLSHRLKDATGTPYDNEYAEPYTSRSDAAINRQRWQHPRRTTQEYEAGDPPAPLGGQGDYIGHDAKMRADQEANRYDTQHRGGKYAEGDEREGPYRVPPAEEDPEGLDNYPIDAAHNFRRLALANSPRAESSKVSADMTANSRAIQHRRARKNAEGDSDEFPPRPPRQRTPDEDWDHGIDGDLRDADAKAQWRQRDDLSDRVPRASRPGEYFDEDESEEAEDVRPGDQYEYVGVPNDDKTRRPQGGGSYPPRPISHDQSNVPRGHLSRGHAGGGSVVDDRRYLRRSDANDFDEADAEDVSARRRKHPMGRLVTLRDTGEEGVIIGHKGEDESGSPLHSVYFRGGYTSTHPQHALDFAEDDEGEVVDDFVGPEPPEKPQQRLQRGDRVITDDGKQAGEVTTRMGRHVDTRRASGRYRVREAGELRTEDGHNRGFAEDDDPIEVEEYTPEPEPEPREVSSVGDRIRVRHPSGKGPTRHGRVVRSYGRQGTADMEGGGLEYYDMDAQHHFPRATRLPPEQDHAEDQIAVVDDLNEHCYDEDYAEGDPPPQRKASQQPQTAQPIAVPQAAGQHDLSRQQQAKPARAAQPNPNVNGLARSLQAVHESGDSGDDVHPAVHALGDADLVKLHRMIHGAQPKGTKRSRRQIRDEIVRGPARQPAAQQPPQQEKEPAEETDADRAAQAAVDSIDWDADDDRPRQRKAPPPPPEDQVPVAEVDDTPRPHPRQQQRQQRKAPPPPDEPIDIKDVRDPRRGNRRDERFDYGAPDDEDLATRVGRTVSGALGKARNWLGFDEDEDPEIEVVDDTPEPPAKAPRRINEGDRVISDDGKQRGVVNYRYGNDVITRDVRRPLGRATTATHPTLLRHEDGHNRGFAEDDEQSDGGDGSEGKPEPPEKEPRYLGDGDRVISDDGKQRGQVMTVGGRTVGSRDEALLLDRTRRSAQHPIGRSGNYALGNLRHESDHARGMAEPPERNFGKAQTEGQAANYQQQQDAQAAAAAAQVPNEPVDAPQPEPQPEVPDDRPQPHQLKIQSGPYGDHIDIDTGGGRMAKAYRPRHATDYGWPHAIAGYDPFEDRSPERAAHLATPPAAEDYDMNREGIIEDRYEELRDQYEQELTTDWQNLADDQGMDMDDYAQEAISDEASDEAYENARRDEDHIDSEYAKDVFSHLPIHYLHRDPDFTALHGALKANPHRREDQMAMNDWLEEHGLDRFKFYFDDDEDHPRARPFDEPVVYVE